MAGACLYIVCRQENKPFMLIDFSDMLQTNVYVLGAVFLQLCRLLRLEQHPLFQKPVDPSLFIHRFADRLDFKKKMHAVANTALRLVASMKRDWMQTGAHAASPPRPRRSQPLGYGVVGVRCCIWHALWLLVLSASSCADCTGVAGLYHI